MSATISYRAGVDIGGTFTDIVLADSTGRVHTKKVSSTPGDYGRAIVDGLLAIMEAVGGHPSQIVELVHATTVATNTVLEGKGARTALITTQGFRDVLEIGRLRVPGLYNLNYSKPVPLALRRHRLEVSERLSADGSVSTPLDEATVTAAIERIRSESIESVAVSLLHSYANPAHEVRIREMLEAAFGDSVYITCSHEILPEIREYERTSTTVVNAYLGPVVVGYLRGLIGKLRAIGMTAPVRIMHSNGGVMTAETVMQKPAAIIESGPAAGVIAGAFVAASSGYSDVITVDMGGTTAKAAIIEAGQPARTTEYEVGAGINLSSKLVKGGGHAVKLPFIDVSEIGAGGGSKVRLDAGGLIRVGPDSAGSVPGPVCYDAGGNVPTLTDAVVTLGYLNPRYLAGGEVPINAAKAREALTLQVAQPAGVALLDAAYGVFSIAAATMTRAVKAVSIYRGRDPREFAMFAFGGNGPVIAHAIAGLMDMRTVIIPPSPGVFSALGLLYSETQHEYMRTLLRRFDLLEPGELEAAFEELLVKATAATEADDVSNADVEFKFSLDLRYAEQAFELTVPIHASRGQPIDMERVVAAFHEEHRKTYGHFSATDAIELVNVRLVGSVVAKDKQTYVGSQAGHSAQLRGAADSSRPAYFGKAHGLVETPVIRRSDLRDKTLPGPLIVEEYDSTCVVPPGASVTIDADHNILITMPHSL
jgi:N-methylhydantoinase A